MALDFDEIASALAACYADLTPPTGRESVKFATAYPPNNLSNLPAVVAYPPNGEITIQPGRRDGEHEFDVVFLVSRAEGDLARRTKLLLQWLGILLDATNAQLKLGVSTVKKAIPKSYEPDVFEYGGTDYDGWRITVGVWTEDAITLTA